MSNKRTLANAIRNAASYGKWRADTNSTEAVVPNVTDISGQCTNCMLFDMVL